MRLKHAKRWLINETRRWTSTLKKLREQGLIDEAFEIMLNNLTLEDIIAIKLELSSKTLHSPVFAMRLWKTLPYVTRDALIKFVVSTTQTTAEAAAYLGIDQRQLFKITNKYGLVTYYDPPVAKKVKEGLRRARERRFPHVKNKNTEEATNTTPETTTENQ